MSDESRMTDLKRYLSYKNVLNRPTFESEDDARENMRAKDGEFRRFIIRGELGTYRVCYAYMAQSRDSDELHWAFNEEYSFSHSQMNAAKNSAALAVGLELIAGKE